MARYAKFFSVGGGAGPNNLQLPVGTILDATLRQVQDGLGTGSPLYLSTGGLRVGTTAGSAMYWDDVNNRLGIGTLTPTSKVHIKGVGTTSATTSLLTQSSAGTTTFSVGDDGNILVGASTITFNNNANFNRITSNFGGVTYDNDGLGSLRASYTNGRYSTLDRVGFGGVNNAFSRVYIVGTGSTSATTSLLVQNSAGSAVLTAKDDLSLVVNDWSSQKITFTSVADNYSQIDFGNTLDTRRAFIRGGRNAQYLFIGFPDFPNYGTNFTPTLVSIGRSKDAPTPLRVNGTPAFSITDEAIVQVNGGLNTTNSGAKLAFLCGDDNADSPVDSGGILVLKTNTFGTGTNSRMIFYNRQLTTLVERMRIADSGNLLVGTTSDLARLTVRGSGSTSATTSLLVQNSAGITALQVRDDLVQIANGYGFYFTHPTFSGSMRIENTGNFTQRLVGAYGENITFGPSNSIRINASEVSCSASFSAGNLTLSGNASYQGGTIAIGNFVCSNTPTNFGLTILSNYTNNGAGGPNVGKQVRFYDNLVPNNIQMDMTFAYVNPIINYQGTANGAVVGYDFNPVVTAVTANTKIRAFQSSVGGVYINTTTYQASAVLQADSTTQGFLPPRVTTAQKNAISLPANGLMVYDTDLVRLCFFNGATWITL